jgi:hydroxymethylpyrimidine pyrophosphatase-like HAD family hydrolase/nucleoside-triphosphatase THEP1
VRFGGDRLSLRPREAASATARTAARGRIVLLTGAPGAGKTGVCQRVAHLTRHKGFRVSGLITEARRLASGRIVQTVVNLRTGERRRLADYIGVDKGEPIGSGVAGRFSWTFVSDSVRWGRHELDRCLTGRTDLLVVDQLGPLELVAGSGWANAVDVLRARRFDLGLVVVNPLVMAELRRRLGDASAVAVEVGPTTHALLPELLDGLVGGHSSTDHHRLLADGGPDWVIADVDGTLVECGARAPAPAVIAGVHELEEVGVCIVVCTGRPTERAVEVADHLGLRRGFIVSYGGAETLDVGTAEVVARAALDGVAERFVTTLADTLGLTLSVHESPAGALRLVLTGDVRQVEHAELAVDEALRGTARWSRPAPSVLAVQTWAATKLEALVTLVDRVGVDPARVAYVGDAADDAPALAWAGLGVAMARGSQEAEAAGDIVMRPDELPELLIRFALARRLRTAD